MRSNFDMRTKESGFSLLEVLVATLIMGTKYRPLAVWAAAASEWSRALLVAQTRLAVAASALPLRESTDQGSETDGRVRWETKVAPYTPPNTTDDLERASEALPARLYRVSVDVRFPSDNGRDRVVSLSTLELGARNPL